MASNTVCTSDGELAITFKISAVAVCCSRASFRSCLGPETERPLTRVAVGAMGRLVLVILRPFAALALRAFAPLVLLPVLDGRVMSAPRVKKGHLIGPDHHSGRGGSSRAALPTGPSDVSEGSKAALTIHVTALPVCPPRKQTSAEPIGMSRKCQNRTFIK